MIWNHVIQQCLHNKIMNLAWFRPVFSDNFVFIRVELIGGKGVHSYFFHSPSIWFIKIRPSLSHMKLFAQLNWEIQIIAWIWIIDNGLGQERIHPTRKQLSPIFLSWLISPLAWQYKEFFTPGALNIDYLNPHSSSAGNFKECYTIYWIDFYPEMISTPASVGWPGLFVLIGKSTPSFFYLLLPCLHKYKAVPGTDWWSYSK